MHILSILKLFSSLWATTSPHDTAVLVQMMSLYIFDIWCSAYGPWSKSCVALSTWLVRAPRSHKRMATEVDDPSTQYAKAFRRY